MTRIDFYFNVSNKSKLLVELVHGALNKRRLVTIVADDALKANEISISLWQHEPTSFMPNALATDAVAAQSSVVIHWQEEALLQDDMLINLTQTEPSFFSRFTHLVELVSDEEEDKVTARARYKFYRDRGYEIKNINYAQP